MELSLSKPLRTINIQTLPIEIIRRDSGAQFRTELNETHVQNLIEALERGDILPPVVVFFDGKIHWMGGGDHRIEAHVRFGLTEIQADVQSGSQRDARFFGTGDNADHGLVRSPKVKRAQVTTLLQEWSELGISGIAKHAKVSRPFVYQVINDDPELKLSCKRLQDSEPRIAQRGGQSYSINTSNMTFSKPQIETLRVAGEVREIAFEDLKMIYDHPEFAAKYPLTVLTDAGLTFDGTLEHSGLNGAIREDEEPDATQPLFVKIRPDAEFPQLYWIDVFWQGGESKSSLNEPVPFQMLTFKLDALGVPMETLEAFRWSSQPVGRSRQLVANVTANGLEMGGRLRHSKEKLGDEQFALWIEAEFAMTVAQADGFIAAVNRYEIGESSEIEVQTAINEALEALPELVWLHTIQGLEKEQSGEVDA